MKRTGKKFLAWALTLSMACSLCTPAVMAESMVTSPAPLISSYSLYSDIKGHWAEDAITRWSKYNVVAGFGSEFKPDGVLTRAQMATILSNLLGLTKESTSNPFKDVANDAWYKTYILRCYEAGVMSGDGVNANPESFVTRQEAMTMLCNALGITPVSDPDLSAFVDGENTASWAAPYMAAMVKAGYVGGVGDGKLSPGGEMTRAASMAVLKNAVVQYINAEGEYVLTNGDGIILVASGGVTLTGETKANILVTPAADGKTVNFDKAVITGGITVQADNAKIIIKASKLPDVQFTGTDSKVENATETGKKPVAGGSGHGGNGSSGSGSSSNGSSSSDGNTGQNTLTISEDKKEITSGTYQTVTITDAVGDGEVILANVTILGDLIVRGGGSNSIKLDNCKIGGKVVMDKPRDKGEPPRLELTNTPVPKVEAKSPAIVEATDTLSSITEVDAKAPVTIQGEKTQIQAVNAQADLSVKGGKVDKITIPPQANAQKPVHISVGKGAKLDKLEANAPAKIDAQGSVNEVTAKADVEVEAGTVNRVTVPETSTAVCVTVGEAAVVSDITVNATDVIIQNDGQVNGLSTELEMPPEVKKEGKNKDKMPTDICKHSWGGAWEYLDEDNHKKTCKYDETHIWKEHHKWNKEKVIKEATATENGLVEYKCGPCSSTKREIIPAKMTPEQQAIIRKAREAGLLRYLDVIDLGGMNRLEMAKLIAAERDWDISQKWELNATDRQKLSELEKILVALNYETGFFAGYEDGEFKPENLVTRADMAVILAKMLYGADVDPRQFEDIECFTDVPKWAAGWVNLCASLGLFTPLKQGEKFNPNETVDLITALQWILNLKAGKGPEPEYLWVEDSFQLSDDWYMIAKFVREDGTTRTNEVKYTVQNAPADFSSAVDCEVTERIDVDGDGKWDKSNLDGKIFRGCTDDTGAYSLTYVDHMYNPVARYAISNGKVFMDGGEDNVIVDQETVFVDVKNGKSYVGYQNVPDCHSAEIAYALDKQIVKVVFILDYIEGYLWVKKSDCYLGTWQAKVCFKDGTTAAIDLNNTIIRATGDEVIEWLSDTRDRSNIDQRVFKYTVDDKGIYTLIYVDAEYPDTKYSIENGSSFMKDLNGDSNVLVDKKTVFIKVKNQVTYEGCQNVPNIENAQIAYLLNDDGVADFVYILDYQCTAEDSYYYVADAAAYKTFKENDKEYVERAVYVDGEKAEVIILASEDISRVGLYKITAVNDKGYVLGVEDMPNLVNADHIASNVGNATFISGQRQALDAKEPITTKYWIYNDDTVFVVVGLDDKTVTVGSAKDIVRHADVKTSGEVFSYLNVVTAEDNVAKLVYIAQAELDGPYDVVAAMPVQEEMYYYPWIYHISNDTGAYQITYTMYSNSTGEKVEITDPTKYSEKDQVHQVLQGITEGFYHVQDGKPEPVFILIEHGVHGQSGNAYYVTQDTAVYDKWNDGKLSAKDCETIAEQTVFTDVCGSGLDSYQKVVDAVENGAKVQLAYMYGDWNDWGNSNALERIFVIYSNVSTVPSVDATVSEVTGVQGSGDLSVGDEVDIKLDIPDIIR